MGKLTAKACENAKPTIDGKPKRYADGLGLYLEAGSRGKYWRAAYRFEGKQKTAAFGVYPEVSLAQARAAHAVFRQTLAQGIDPNAQKKQAKAEAGGITSFASIAEDWLETTAKAKNWTDKHRTDIALNLKNHILPAFGRLNIEALTAPDIIAHIAGIAQPYTAEYTLGNIKRICRHAFNMRLIPYSPAELLKAGELLPAHQGNPMRHIVEPEIIGEALIAIERAPAALPASRAFLRLLPYLFCRPSELRLALWQELQEDTLHIPKERMKKRRPHLIPIPRQAQALIEEMRLHSAHTPYILANTFGGRIAPITEGAAYKILKSNRIRQGQSLHELTTLHGWRHTASTLLHEQGYPSHLIEMQLAHADKNSVRGTYNHADYLDDRRAMMQAYADYLDGLKAQALEKEQQCNT